MITRLSMMTLMLALVACSEAESPPVDPATEPAAPASPSSTPAADSSAPCQAAQLALALESSDAGAGNRGHTLAVTNTGNAGCTLEGWPEVRLLDAADRELDSIRAEQTLGSYFQAGEAPRPVQLESQGRAYFDLLSSAIPHGDEGECPRAAAIRVTPPGDVAAMELDLELQPCGGRVRGTPLRPVVQP